MRVPRFYTSDTTAERRWRVAADVVVILLLVAAMVAIRAHAPAQTYNYAQFWQIRVSIDHLHGGSWLLGKIDPLGTPARKGPLYAWLLTATMKLTGVNNDFVFRVPTILASAGLAVLVYLLGRRWCGRRAGLFAACLWVTCLHMSKLTYLATTDMLLAWWIGLCVFCADRLTFHPAQKRRWVWAVGLWAAMIFGALTKSWGIVNFVIVGGFLALAGGFGPGFVALRKARGAGKFVLAGRVILRRWWSLAKAVHLSWGLLAMLLVFVPLGWATLRIGGEAFRETLRNEIWQRLTGQGAHVHGAARVPAILHLYYNTLPVSIFAGCAFFFVPLRRWLTRRSPIALPTWWILTVLLAFGVSRGFRPDYLLPCYVGVALLAGWAVAEMSRPERYAGRVGKHVRRIAQAVPFVLAAALLVIPPLYVFHRFLPASWTEVIPLPPQCLPGTWMILSVLPTVGVVLLWLSVRAVRRKRLGLTVAVTCLGMLGVLFCNAHLLTRQARTGDGEVMLHFARDAQPIVGEEAFLVYAAGKLGTEVYLGRFGRWLKASPEAVLEDLRRPPERWLITSDIGLLHLGAYEDDPAGEVAFQRAGTTRRSRMCPQDLGRVAVRSVAPIRFEKWGRIYLIKLTSPPRPRSRPFRTGYISDPVR